MTPLELKNKVQDFADRLEGKVKGVDRNELELILWNLFREKKDPFDFLLKRVGENKFAR